MAVPLEQFVKHLEDSGVIDGDTLKDFLPPRASPKDAEELARELVRQKKLTKYQAEVLWQGKGKSLVLGNYVLLEKIGAGGMGQVFKARHRRMDRLVAVKLLPAAMTKDKAAIARFEREVKAAARLRHSHIIAADDADQANGVHFLVMELVDGSDLSALVKRNGPFRVSQGVNYILQAAKGLEYAHAEGVVHRDIKPANLLLDKKGTVKILDMGLARIHGETGGDAAQAELTASGTIMGTVDYMAPEQAMNTKTADARADIYSLGCSLYYLLTGKAAYDGETLMAKLMAHRDEPIPDLRAACPDVPQGLESVFKQMVAKKIEDRYQTMTAVIADLERCSVGQGGVETVSLPSFSGSDTGLTDFLKEVSAAPPKSVIQKTSAIRTPQGNWRDIARSKRKLLIRCGVLGGVLGGLILLAGLVLGFKKDGGTPIESGDKKSIAARRAPVDDKPAAAVAARGWHGWPADAPKAAVAPFDADAAKIHQATWAAWLKQPVESTDRIGTKLVLIPPGEYKMGTDPSRVRELHSSRYSAEELQKTTANEQPLHRVIITRPFWMGATEFTVGQFKKFIAATGYKTEAELAAKEAQAPTWLNPGCDATDDMPVTCISWNDAVACCKWLSEQEQSTYRLPTEAEWEYACRAGTKTPYFFGSDSGGIHVYGWFKDNVKVNGTLGPAGEKLPNPFGLYDMHGNVWEWCQDFFDEKWYEKSPVNDPTGPEIGSLRVLRGGYRSYDGLSWRSACRSSAAPSSSDRHPSWKGFRIVRVLDAMPDTRRATKTAAARPNPPWKAAAFQAWMKKVQGMPAERQVEAVSLKLMKLNRGFDGKLTGPNGIGQPTIAGGVVTELHFDTDRVTDISPVRALAGLKTLSCSEWSQDAKGRCKLTDLSPLQGMRLESLDLRGNRPLTDLTPLQGMPLKRLVCYDTSVSSLSPLKGAKLVYLHISGTNVSDLSPLQGMPLVELVMQGTQVSDLSPLKDVPLRGIGLDFIPARDLESLRAIKTLETINSQPAAEFLKKAEEEQKQGKQQ